MGTLALPKRLSPEEYLQRERQADFKSEYYDGTVRAMAGATRTDVQIVQNVARFLGNSLEGGACETYTSDLKVWIAAATTFCYPDVLVICGETRYLAGRTDAVENPKVIFEVLSESTETYDRRHKFRKYKMIPELEQYVLVAQDEPVVEVFSRRELGFWLVGEFSGLEAMADLHSIGVAIPLKAIYRNVDMAAVTE
jgi:Uma2 family endonuclease